MVKNGKIGDCLIQSIKKEIEAQDMNNCTHSFTHSHTVLIGVLFLLQDKENGNSTAKSEYTISAKNKFKKTLPSL